MKSWTSTDTIERSERIFALHAKRIGIARLLDVGAHSGQFATKMRQYGFDGVIYSVEPLMRAHEQLRQNARDDVRWIPLPRRAAPDTRTVTHEKVFVSRTADLLREPLMKKIDALKIDVQVYELEVIEGLRSSIDGVRLVMLAMSSGECHAGAPDLFALDHVLVEELGYSRISDGIYIRDLPPTVNRSAASDFSFSAVLTSMHGTPSRVTPSGAEIGPDWRNLCVDSWQRQSDRVISVSEVQPDDPRVQWVETNARPAIADLLAAAPDENGHTILCNADIFIVDALAQFRARLDPSTVYLAHRIEVEADAANPQAVNLKSIYQWGFDLFVLPAEFTKIARDFGPLAGDFRIGEPWWDYLLPLLALAAGFPVKTLPLDPPVALHHIHSTRYEQATWLNRGAQFMSTIETLMRIGSSRDIELLQDLSSLEGPLEARLHAATKLVCSRLS